MESSANQPSGMQESLLILQSKQDIPRTKVNLVLDLQHKTGGLFPLSRYGRKTSVTQLSPFSLIIFLDESSSLLFMGFQATSSRV